MMVVRHLALIVLTASASASAQNALCVAPHPLSRGCSGFLEVSPMAAAAITTTRFPLSFGRTTDDLPAYGGVGVGYLRNVDSALAVGIAGQIGYSQTGRAAVLAEVRRWIGNGHAVEVGVGPLVTDVLINQNNTDARARSSGVAVQLSAIERHGLGVFADLDRVAGGNRTSTAVHLGARVESWPAVLAIAGTAAAYAVIWGAVLSR